MIMYTMTTLVIKEGPQSVPSGFGIITQVFQSIFNEKNLTVMTTNDVKTQAEGAAHRIFYVVDLEDDCPSSTAEWINRIETEDKILTVFAEPKPKELS